MVLARAETSVHFVHTFRIRTRAVSLPLHACVSLKPAHASGCFRAPRTVSVPASPTHAHADQVARCLALHSRAPAARERAASGVNKICSEIGEQTRFAAADFACAPPGSADSVDDEADPGGSPSLVCRCTSAHGRNRFAMLVYYSRL